MELDFDRGIDDMGADTEAGLKLILTVMLMVWELVIELAMKVVS